MIQILQLVLLFAGKVGVLNGGSRFRAISIIINDVDKYKYRL